MTLPTCDDHSKFGYVGVCDKCVVALELAYELTRTERGHLSRKLTRMTLCRSEYKRRFEEQTAGIVRLLFREAKLEVDYNALKADLARLQAENEALRSAASEAYWTFTEWVAKRSNGDPSSYPKMLKVMGELRVALKAPSIVIYNPSYGNDPTPPSDPKGGS